MEYWGVQATVLQYCNTPQCTAVLLLCFIFPIAVQCIVHCAFQQCMQKMRCISVHCSALWNAIVKEYKPRGSIKKGGAKVKGAMQITSIRINISIRRSKGIIIRISLTLRTRIRRGVERGLAERTCDTCDNISFIRRTVSSVLR